MGSGSGSAWTAALAFIAGAGALVGVAELVAAFGPALVARAPAFARLAAELAEAPLRLGREGRSPGARERRRLLVAGALCTFAAGAVLAGPVPGLVLASFGPWVASRVLAAARERYRRGVGAGAAGIALALADALGGGHSIRGAVGEAALGLGGPPGQELRRVARELALGAPTDSALEAMRARVRSHGIDTIVAACLLQRRSGGDLARLLRDCARALEDQERLERDARAATAQARFTGLIVVMLPLGGGLLAELASPGYLRSLAGSFLTAWLAGLALGMQVVAAVLIRRLGRVRT
jgi:tight adherence protein B